MKALSVAVWALDSALYVALGYIFNAILPLTTPGLGLVRFWPQVIIPGVFAAIFGPWVGGFGAAMGIFISDMLIHGNPILSLMAGVTSNFVCFFLIGYIANKNIEWKIPMLGFGVITAMLVWIAYNLLPPAYTQYALIVSAIVVGTYVAVLIAVWLTPRWRSYEVGCMIGLLIGSAIIGAMVPIFSQFFVIPGQTELTPLTASAGFAYLVWTFSTEIPFLIVLGPPILEAVYRAFPALRRRGTGNDSSENR